MKLQVKLNGFDKNNTTCSNQSIIIFDDVSMDTDTNTPSTYIEFTCYTNYGKQSVRRYRNGEFAIWSKGHQDFLAVNINNFNGWEDLQKEITLEYEKIQNEKQNYLDSQSQINELKDEIKKLENWHKVLQNALLNERSINDSILEKIKNTLLKIINEMPSISSENVKEEIKKINKECPRYCDCPRGKICDYMKKGNIYGY